mgnify:CR=1 FL=1
MVVLITGCRSGFGLLAAVSAAQAGHTVYAGLRDVETAGELRRRSTGLDVRPVQLDVTSESDRHRVVESILDKHGNIGALVNNAGVAIGGFQEEVTEAEVRKVFEVNVFGVWALTRLVLPHMRRAGFGHIVNVSSVAGRIALPGLGVYAASKHAMEGMTESLRHEVSAFGVRVTLVQPGPYRTDMTAGPNRRLTGAASDPDSPYAARTARAEALFERISARMGDPQDVADRIVDLLDEDSPRLRHPLGPSAKARLAFRWLFPFSAWEFVVARLTGAPEQES